MPRLVDPKHWCAVFLALFAAIALAGCSSGKVITGGPQPTASPTTPKFTNEFKVTTGNSGPSIIVTGQDGFMYFTETAASQIAQLSTGGSIKEIKTPTAAAAPFGITVNLSSAGIFFTERAVHKIGSITTFTAATPITEYTIPWAPSVPTFISSGLAQNTMYFVDAGANAIGQVTTTGTFSGPFPIPTANANPPTFPTGGITLGSDGNMWFSEYNAAKIGHLNTATNTVDHEYALSPGANPAAIITASDGAVWFTENNAAAPKLGRLSPSGVLNEYPLAGAASATGLTQDAQGLFVVVDTANNSVGRFDPITLAYTEYPITTASAGPEWVTVGPDGRIYVTETTANQIGQFSYF